VSFLLPFSCDFLLWCRGKYTFQKISFFAEVTSSSAEAHNFRVQIPIVLLKSAIARSKMKLKQTMQTPKV
jgi:hypothetical protein